MAHTGDFEHRSGGGVPDRAVGGWRSNRLDHGGLVRRFSPGERDRAVRGLSLDVVVSDVHQCHAPPVGKSREHRQQVVSSLRVDHRRHFVGDEQRRFARQRGGDGQPLQLPAGQAAGVAIGKSVQADFGKQAAHLSTVSGGQPPHHVIGDSTAQHLTLRMLQDHRGSTEVAKPDCTGTFHRSRGGLAAGEDQHQRGLAGTVRAGDGDVLPGTDAHCQRTDGVVVHPGVAERDLAQLHRDGCDRSGLRGGVQLVHVGDLIQPT